MVGIFQANHLFCLCLNSNNFYLLCSLRYKLFFIHVFRQEDHTISAALHGHRFHPVINSRQRGSGVNFIQNISPGLQNLLHVPLFGMLTLLWFFTLVEYKLEIRQATLWAGVVTVVYGIFDEIHQFFVPGRYPGLGDVLLNCLGVFVVSFYIHRSRIRKPKRVK